MQRRHEVGSGASIDAPIADRPPLLELRDVRTHFPLRGSFGQRLIGREAGSVKAVDGVSLRVHHGEVLGLVGESGSGKTTLGRTILGLADVTSGSVLLEGTEIAGLSESAFRPYRRRMQMVFQDPHASLNPAMDLLTAIGHPLVVHGIVTSPAALREAVGDALERVGLTPVEQFFGKYPGDLSGGQKQRAVLARAIILGPDLLVADEPVSMLDMSVRAKILELMLELKSELDLTYLYITHDLATAKFFCDRVAIMYLGRIVEIGPTDAIFADPKHPYTESLMRAIPDPDPDRAVPRDVPRGEVPDAVSPPLGCSFHPRCPKAFEVCGWESRDLKALIEARWASIGADEYERDRELLGELNDLEVASTNPLLPARRRPSADAVVAYLRQLRQEGAQEPLWKGVRSIEAEAGGARVTFADPREPLLQPAGDVEVACHLFDESE